MPPYLDIGCKCDFVIYKIEEKYSDENNEKYNDLVVVFTTDHCTYEDEDFIGRLSQAIQERTIFVIKSL